MIEYLVGDATEPIGDGNKAIPHVCNDIGGWGRGFVLALSAKWEEPEREYRAWFAGERDIPFELGKAQFVDVEPDIAVVNIIGQRHIYPIDGVPPVRYEAIRSGLEEVCTYCLENSASVHMPRIGCGLAGGKWKIVESIIEETLLSKGVDVYVYDLPKVPTK